LVSKGGFAKWNNGTSLYLRDLALKTNSLVSNNAGNTGNSVTASGKVAFWTNNYQVFTYKNGITTPVSNPTDNYSSTTPVLDDTNIVYRRIFNAQHQPNLIWMYNGQSHIQLSEIGTTFPQPNSEYAASNGWIAFVKLGGSGQTQI
jgi:hypothetical protein